MTIRLVEAEVFHANSQRKGWTDNTQLIVTSHNSAKSPKKE